MDDLTATMDTICDDAVRHPAVHSATAWGVVGMNKWYKHSDKSYTPQIAISMSN